MFFRNTFQHEKKAGGKNIALLAESNCVSLCPQLRVQMHIIIKESLAGFTGPRAAEKQ
jgi:hypothetical protein